MSAISTHVLDTSCGKPASDVAITLECLQSGTWFELGAGRTDADGRLRTLLGTTPLEAATYRLTFDIAPYFTARHVRAFFPSVQITFEVSDATQHHHVPLLLSPFGYSTYRGS